MTDAEWAEDRSAMPVPAWLLKRGGRPEALLKAARCLVDNSVKWMAMPVDFPYWRAVYAFFHRRRTYDYAGELHDRLRHMARVHAGRNAESSAGVIYSQSVDASKTVGEDSRGYDGGKSRDGRKRHTLTDIEGLLLEVTVTTPMRTTSRRAGPWQALSTHTSFSSRPGWSMNPSSSTVAARRNSAPKLADVQEWHHQDLFHRAEGPELSRPPSVVSRLSRSRRSRLAGSAIAGSRVRAHTRPSTGSQGQRSTAFACPISPQGQGSEG